MKNFFMVSFVLLGIISISVLGSAAAAHAEPERYNLPVLLDQKMEPVKVILPSMPTFENMLSEDLKAEMLRQDLDKRREAQRASIAVLLQKYNRKLSDEKAYDYALYIMQASEKFKQEPFVIAAMVVNESSAKHDVVSKGGDYGLMQVRWRVHQKKIKKKYPHIIEASDMLNPKDNLLVGTEIFSTYHATAKQDVRGALLYYSAGNERLADKIFAVLSQLEKSYVELLKKS